MKVSLQRKIDQKLGSVICRFISFFPIFQKKEKSQGPVRKILVIFLSEMGSLTLAAAMFERLQEKYPKAAIYILTFQKNAEILHLLAFTSVNNILTVRDDSFSRLTGDSLKVLWRLRRSPPSVVIDGELFSRISSLYAFFSKAPVKVGFHRYTQEGLYRGDFLNRPVLYNPHVHISEQFINLAEAVESFGEPMPKRALSADKPEVPEVWIESWEKAQMEERINRAYPVLGDRALIILHPGGGLLPIRAWPPEKYGKVARFLTDKGFGVAVTGTVDDRPLATMITGFCSRYCVDMTGFTGSVKELLTVFSLSRLLITNDGGPGHFAGLVGLPAIILYGPESAQLYGSLSTQAINIGSNFSCSPCLTAYNHRNSPCDGNNLCLQAITPETVIEAALQKL